MDRICENCRFYVQVSSARGICRKDEIVRHEVSAIFVCGDFERYSGASDDMRDTDLWSRAILGEKYYGKFDEEDVFS